MIIINIIITRLKNAWTKRLHKKQIVQFPEVSEIDQLVDSDGVLEEMVERGLEILRDEKQCISDNIMFEFMANNNIPFCGCVKFEGVYMFKYIIWH